MPVAPSTVQKKGERGVTGDLVDASGPDPEPEFDVGEVGEDNIRFCATLKRLWVFRLDSSVAEATNVTDVSSLLPLGRTPQERTTSLPMILPERMDACSSLSCNSSLRSRF
jgi:hypothetical protein